MKIGKPIDKIVSNPLFAFFFMGGLIIFALAFAIGSLNVINLLGGTNAYFKEEGYCKSMFVEKYEKEPYEVTISLAGDCLYKLDEIQDVYLQWHELK